MYKKLKVSLVIPAYNEERLIGSTLEKIPKTIDRVYVIDDSSFDRTPYIIKEYSKKDKRIKLIQHEFNRGVGNAIISGYKKSVEDGYDVAVVIGGDNQMDLTDLPNFLEPFVKNEADYVKGNRFIGKGSAFKVMPKKRFLGNSILSFLTKFSSGYWNVFDTQDGYTAISKKAIETIDWNKAWGGYGYPSDWLVLFNTYNLRIKDVPRRAIYLPGVRQSQIKIGKYVFRMLPLFFRRFFWRLKTKYLYQQFHPLVLFYLLGFILLPLGVLLGLWILINIKGTVSGNQAILCALFIITGLQSLLFAMLFDMQTNAHLQK